LKNPNSKSNPIPPKIYKSRQECPHSGNFPNGGISHPLNLVTDTKRRRIRNGGGNQTSRAHINTKEILRHGNKSSFDNWRNEIGTHLLCSL